MSHAEWKANTMVAEIVAIGTDHAEIILRQCHVDVYLPLGRSSEVQVRAILQDMPTIKESCQPHLKGDYQPQSPQQLYFQLPLRTTQYHSKNMLFQPAKILLAAGVLASMLTAVIAVDLFQYTRAGCTGNVAHCRNIRARVCCRSRERDFVSARCSGCRRDDSHFTWRRRGNNFCGLRVFETHDGFCSAFSRDLRGHSWCNGCALLSENRINDEAACTESVEPDLLRIDGTWFHLNESVPQSDRDNLWALWSSEATAADIPKSLLQYEGPAPSAEG
ncbi:hypothetical protein AJ80_05011 [Polytolypa hystricis UAMH7299]|uniref:Uncharacterized protein n=1 Tax=Polytolypa hystricis (strain UAMH7299) TaxID=1447883 RepID=A0A2B7Y7C1_POLH7|nr:hypothetical protein AJ80_05011 [Polytolypa hystricis UAMH7299]